MLDIYSIQSGLPSEIRLEIEAVLKLKQNDGC